MAPLSQLKEWLLGSWGQPRVAACSSSSGKSEYWDDFVDSFTASCVNGGFPQLLRRPGEEDGFAGAGTARNATPVSVAPAAKRLVAIGDLHGDFEKACRAFEVAGLVDENLDWVGGKTVAVQVGDVLDRGGEELQIFHLLEKLKGQASEAGGALHVLNGNHEIINVAGRFRYATRSAMEEFQRWEQVSRFGKRLKCLCSKDRRRCEAMVAAASASGIEARKNLLKPGGEVSQLFLAQNPVALVVGSSVFVHGGLHPNHLDYGLERMNAEASEWIRGQSKDEDAGVPWFLQGRNAIVWSRMYSQQSEERCDCEMLKEALQKLPGTRRMVVGHTVQYPMGINSVCNDSVFRVDVGASSGVVDAEPEVLEIVEDRIVRRLRSNQAAQVLVSASDALRMFKHPFWHWGGQPNQAPLNSIVK